MTRFANFLCIIPFFMVLATILIVDYSIPNGINFGKQFWFYLSIGITSITTIIAFIVNRKTFKLNYIDGLLTIFLIVGIVLSKDSLISSSSKISMFILLYVFYFLLKSFAVQRKSIIYFLGLFFVITGFVEALWALLQMNGVLESHHVGYKTTGSLFNPGPYAGYIAMIIPVAFYYVLRDFRSLKLKFNKRLIPFYFRWIISLTSVLLIAYILPETKSRASWIASVFSCFVVFICYLLYGKVGSKILPFFKRNKWIIGILSLFIIASSGYALNNLYHLRKGSSDIRALIWKISLDAADKHKLGVGIGNYLGVYAEEQSIYLASNEATNREKTLAITTEFAYNELIHVLIEFGVLGLIVFLLLIFGSLISGIRNRKIGYVGGVISLMTFALMSYPFSIIGFLVAFIFLIAMCATNSKYEIKTSFVSNLAILGILSCICLFIVYHKLPGYEAHKHWEDIKKNRPQYENILAEYQGLERYLGDNVHFLLEYSREFRLKDRDEDAIRILKSASKIGGEPSIYMSLADAYKNIKDYSTSEDYFYKAINFSPKTSFLAYYKLGEMYIESKSTDKAQAIIDYIAKTYPSVESTNRLRIKLGEIKKEVQ